MLLKTNEAKTEATELLTEAEKLVLPDYNVDELDTEIHLVVQDANNLAPKVRLNIWNGIEYFIITVSDISGMTDLHSSTFQEWKLLLPASNTRVLRTPPSADPNLSAETKT